MRVLVTGGAGYIGSVVVSTLLEAGHNVCIFDNLSRGHRAAADPAAEFVTGDLGDAAELDKLFARAKFDAVVHMAAFVDAGESVRRPEFCYQQNVSNSETLFQAMLGNGVKRLVFSSTAAVYGDRSEKGVTEDAPLAPINPYGRSKLLVEQMLPLLAEEHGLKYACLRYFNAAGATARVGNVFPVATNLIPLAVRAAAGDLPHLEILGTDYDTPDGTGVRDYVHVTDVADAHVISLRALEQGRSFTYNIGSGHPVSVREVVNAVSAVTGKKVSVVEAPRRPGDPAMLFADISRITAELGWRPQHSSLENIVATTWRWYQQHPNGYASSSVAG